MGSFTRKQRPQQVTRAESFYIFWTRKQWICEELTRPEGFGLEVVSGEVTRFAYIAFSGLNPISSSWYREGTFHMGNWSGKGEWGGQSDLRVSAIFSNSLGLRYSVCQGVICWGSTSWIPSGETLRLPDIDPWPALSHAGEPQGKEDWAACTLPYAVDAQHMTFICSASVFASQHRAQNLPPGECAGRVLRELKSPTFLWDFTAVTLLLLKQCPGYRNPVQQVTRDLGHSKALLLFHEHHEGTMKNSHYPRKIDMGAGVSNLAKFATQLNSNVR